MANAVPAAAASASAAPTASPLAVPPSGAIITREADGTVVSRTPPPTGFWDTVVGPVFVVIIIHYLVWLPALAVLAAIVHAVVTRVWPASSVAVYAVPTVCLVALLAYVPSFVDGSEATGRGRPWPAFRRMSMWRWAAQYVDLTLVRTTDLSRYPQVISAWHPHGILILSRIAMYGGRFADLFPHLDERMRALGATPMFRWPGAREISLWLGAVDASPRTAQRVLAAGNSIIVYPGGSREIFHSGEVTTAGSRAAGAGTGTASGSPGADAAVSAETVLELSSRKGFVRLALQNGVPLVPVVVYGERTAFRKLELPAALRNWCLKALRLPLIVFYGRWGTLMPRRLRLSVVVGAPLEVPHVPDIAKEDPRIDEAHGRYVAALRELWEKHKARFGDAAERLAIL